MNEPFVMAFLTGSDVGKVVKKKLRKALALKDLHRQESEPNFPRVTAPVVEGEEPPITPFSYHFEPSIADICLMAAMVPILPLRLLLAGICIVVAWIAATVAMYNVPPQVSFPWYRAKSPDNKLNSNQILSSIKTFYNFECT